MYDPAYSPIITLLFTDELLIGYDAYNNAFYPIITLLDVLDYEIIFPVPDIYKLPYVSVFGKDVDIPFIKYPGAFIVLLLTIFGFV